MIETTFICIFVRPIILIKLQPTMILTEDQLKERKDKARKEEIRQNVKSHCTKIRDGIRANALLVVSVLYGNFSKMHVICQILLKLK